MRPESRKLIWDAREAVARIQEFTTGKTLDNYNAEVLLSSAVERQLEIGGEALHRLSRADPEVAASIDEISRIIGMRNVLAHGYATVDNRLVWDVVTSKLQRLAAQLESLAREG